MGSSTSYLISDAGEGEGDKNNTLKPLIKCVEVWLGFKLKTLYTEVVDKNQFDLPQRAEILTQLATIKCNATTGEEYCESTGK